ncbi:hypothetical protein ATANTOWER_001246 [Ataeniobius toweri]|uniref:Uncharacterized protein n=1 Tax=Ataeniobius toweri TaxID=208326 RepID=A0ABU7B5K4_9TELE|nr:hypothetical protein [Ataeniobius toweri]
MRYLLKENVLRTTEQLFVSQAVESQGTSRTSCQPHNHAHTPEVDSGRSPDHAPWSTTAQQAPVRMALLSHAWKCKKMFAEA